MCENKEIEKVEQTIPVYEEGYVVSVCFENSRNYYFYTPLDSIEKGTDVVVETVRGIELGHVVKGSQNLKDLELKIPLKPITRIATEEDKAKHLENLELAKGAFEICQKSVESLKLDMRLLKAEYTLDASKIIIIYVADNRVDFRELLKDLAAKLKCRIELRQIGTRDRSRLVGGIGTCGLPLCCNSFLGEFDGISINMAKNQFLALNVQKLSGHCGKLMCCLKYEDEQYTELRKGLPKMGYKIRYEDEMFKITSVNILTRQVRVENAEKILLLPLDEVMKIVEKQSKQVK